MSNQTSIPQRGLLLLIATLGFSAGAYGDDYTVGSSGSFATIQAAVDAALAAPGSHTIRIQQGLYTENVVIDQWASTGSLVITGGWRSGFASRSGDPASTVISGGNSGRALLAMCSSGELRLRGLMLERGAAVGSPDNEDLLSLYRAHGGGGLLWAAGNCFLHVTEAIVANSFAINEGTSAIKGAFGGGLSLVTWDSASAFLADLDLRGNLAQSDFLAPGGSSYGGGLAVTSTQDSAVHVTRTQVQGNLSMGYQASGGGAYFLSGDRTRMRFDESIVSDNAVSAKDGTFGGGFRYAGGSSTASEAYEANFERLKIWRNTTPPTGPQVFLSPGGHGTGRFRFSDSVVVGDVFARRDQSGATTIHFTNLTIDGRLRMLTPTPNLAPMSAFNTIVTLGIDLDSDVLSGSNHVGSDPGFRSPADLDYRLTAGSGAIDAGDVFAPGGLGRWDVDLNDRVVGSVDLGAYETTNGPDSVCSVFPAAGQSSPACVCLTDDSLRALRCAVTLPNLLVNVRVPFDFGKPAWMDLRSWNVKPAQVSLAGVLETPNGEQEIGQWQGRVKPNKLTVLRPKIPFVPDSLFRTKVMVDQEGAQQEWELLIDFSRVELPPN